jgi:hypothetical protein
MAPLISAHFERKIKLLFTFWTAYLAVKLVAGWLVEAVGVGVIS